MTAQSALHHWNENLEIPRRIPNFAMKAKEVGRGIGRED